MKKYLRTLTIVTTLLAFSFNSVMANDSIEVKTNDDVAKVLNKKGKRFAKNNAKDLELYYSVMEMYENSPSQFYNLDKQTQEEFLLAASNLTENMSGARKKVLRNLARNLDFNSAVSKFVWDVKEASYIIIPLDNNEIIKTSI